MTATLRALHVVSGDLWAGAEVQAFTLMSHLSRTPNTVVAAVVMNPGTLADKLRGIGIHVHVMDERVLRPWHILVRLRTVISAWQPHVIHTHREKENILATLASWSSGRVPTVRTVHGGPEHSRPFNWRGFRHRLVTQLDLACIRASNQTIIVVSRDLIGRVKQEFPAGKVVVVENGVDAEAVRAQVGVADFRSGDAGATHIGIAGRLVSVKRVDLFLEIAARLREDRPERRWRFHVFGDGPMRSALEANAARLGISKFVSFHGHRNDIAACMQALDALVICSDHEGMPMTALEAAALQVPTIAHAVGGLVDAVPQEFLVYEHDAASYAVAILRAIEKEGREIFRQHANCVVMRYSARRNASRIRALYDEVVAPQSAMHAGEM